jgi:ribosome-associated heat shock protein Hsp15
MDTARVDQWLWAIRLYKSRSIATTACRGGHVRINGSSAKAATPVKAGDRIEVRHDHRDRIFEVVRPIDKRVGAAVAAECFVDLSPAPPRPDQAVQVAARERGAGRPTKRDRRDIEKFRRT